MSRKGQHRFISSRILVTEQYAIRRAAEFVSLTLPPLGAPEDGAEVDALVDPYGLRPRIRVPVSVPPGSPAHAACLAFPTPLLGLEVCYSFNASRQMDKWALHSALSQARARMGEARVHSISHTRPHAQVDAVLGSIAAGVAFDSKTAMGGQGVEAADAAASSPWSAWRDASIAGGAGVGGGSDTATPPMVPERPAADLRSLLDAAARAGSRSMPDAAPGAGGGSSVFSRVFGGGASSSALPPFARPLALLPAHAAAIAALVRGSLSAALGRADEAAAAFTWLTDTATAAGGEIGAAIANREIQALAYAHYEVGVLYADGAKALARKGRARSSVATAPRDPLVLPCDREASAAVAAALDGVTTAADLSASAARKSLSCCAGLLYSLHLRLPLQVRAAPSTMRSLRHRSCAGSTGGMPAKPAN